MVKTNSMSLPRAAVDFLVIGAPKAGTTTLYQYLCRHAQVYMTQPKEPGYFATTHDRGPAWYAGLFAAALPGQVRGEASTVYSCTSDLRAVVDRIAAEASHAKLIYLMRDPVERAYSYYVEQIKTMQMLGRRVGYEETFEAYSTRDPLCLAGGMYVDIVQTYLSRFDRDAMLLLILDDLKGDPASTMRQVARFLEIDDEVDLVSDSAVVANEARSRNEGYLRQQVIEPLRRIPLLGALGERLPQSWRDRIYDSLKRTHRVRRLEQRIIPPPMRDDTRARLIQLYREPTRRLAELLERDLSHWC